MADETKTANKFSKWGFFPITVEPALLSTIFMAACCDGVITNLLVSRVCTEVLHLKSENCSGKLDRHIEQRVQPYTSIIIMYKTLIETILPSILSLFIGPWTDTNGRKPFLIVSMIGHIIAYVIWGFLSLRRLSPYWYLVSSIPIAISGGFVTLLISSTGYINDIVPSDQLSYRFGILEASINSGFVIGFLLSPFLFNLGGNQGYITVFFTCALVTFLSLLYIIFFVKESVQKKKEVKWNIFDLIHIKGIYEVLKQKREYNGRIVTLLTILIYFIRTAQYEGENYVKYLVVRTVFSWDLTEYSTYVVINQVITLIGSWFLTWLFCSFLKLPNIPVVLGALILLLASSVCMTFSSNSLMFYIATNIGFVRSIPGPLLIAHILQLTSKSYTGKLLAFIIMLTAISPQLATLLYNGTYKWMAVYKPLMIYNLTSALNVISIILLVCVLILEKDKPSKEKQLNFSSQPDSNMNHESK